MESAEYEFGIMPIHILGCFHYIKNIETWETESITENRISLVQAGAVLWPFVLSILLPEGKKDLSSVEHLLIWRETLIYDGYWFK